MSKFETLHVTNLPTVAALYMWRLSGAISGLLPQIYSLPSTTDGRKANNVGGATTTFYGVMWLQYLPETVASAYVILLDDLHRLPILWQCLGGSAWRVFQKVCYVLPQALIHTNQWN